MPPDVKCIRTARNQVQMRPEGGTKRHQAAVTNASSEVDDESSRKRKKSESTVKEEVADEERTLYDFDSVYDYLENTKPKREFEDFAALKEQYIPLLVQPGDDYTRQHDVEQDALPRKGHRRIAKLPKDGGIFLDDIPLHHRTARALHPLEEQRLALCGLAIKKWKKWTREEDEILVENWREYAARHNVPLRDAPKFFGATKKGSLEFRELSQDAQTTLFHPWMCKRLLHRTGKQTKDRGRVLLHRDYRLQSGKEMWTADNDKVLLRLVKALNWNYREVALQMGRLREHCVKRYYWLQKHSALNGGTMLQGHLDDKLYWHPVEAARRRGGDYYILWKDAANVTGKSVRDCQNMWKRMKAQFPVSQHHLQTQDVYKIAERALRCCLVEIKEEIAERNQGGPIDGTEPPAEAVYDEAGRGENGAAAPPTTDVTPSQLSQCITILLDQDVLESKRDFNADSLQIKLHSMPSLACPSDEIVRHVRRMLRRCRRAGMWDRLPQEKRTLRGKLEALVFVLARSDELHVPSLRFRKLLKKFAKQGKFELLPRDAASVGRDFVDLRLPSSSE
ncbi:hypothetical protein AAVH_28839 [Aphelenchoides avenae]|nr:hypothetical protein AAVH_28839 [Aphelenchus avenae]